MVIATVLGLLALFSFVSILLSGDDELPEADPRDQASHVGPLRHALTAARQRRRPGRVPEPSTAA